jgi:peptidoglycan glycosyltransferase
LNVRANLELLQTVFLAGFLLVALTLGYWQFFRQDELLGRSTNPRVVEEARLVVRGRILDRTGVPLAQDIGAGDDSHTRTYRSPADGNVVGYHSIRFGNSGVEARYDDYLSGARSADPIGRLKAGLLHEPTRGSDVTLTIDSRIQQAASDVLGGWPGAVVAIDPKTGAILAMVSTPSFDPATIDTKWQQLVDDPGRPLVDRATDGLYTPGSTFKVVTASAAIDLGLIDVDAKYRCVDPISIDNLTVDCRNHSQLPVVSYREAFAWSCNRTFALSGLELGLDKLQLADGLKKPYPWEPIVGRSADRLEEYAGRYGFGRPIPFDLSVATSQLKGSDSWNAALLGQTSFGQGQLASTPLLMALVGATIANGGVEPAPYLAIEARAPNGAVSALNTPGGTLGRVVTAKTAQTMNEMMILSVDAAYAHPAAISGIKVGGKTGTAEAGPDGMTPHSWFVGYAPADDPRVAVAVIMEHRGSGTDYATPAGRAVMQQALDVYKR